MTDVQSFHNTCTLIFTLFWCDPVYFDRWVPECWTKLQHSYLKLEADGFPNMLVLTYNIRRHHIPIHHNHQCKILKSLICVQCCYTLICPFLLQRRRASIATFRPLDSQDSAKTSNTSLTFGVSSQCEGRVVYHLVRSLFIFVFTTTSIMCLGPRRVPRVPPLTEPQREDDHPLPSSTEVSDAYSCDRMISIYLRQTESRGFLHSQNHSVKMTTHFRPVLKLVMPTFVIAWSQYTFVTHCHLYKTYNGEIQKTNTVTCILFLYCCTYSKQLYSTRSPFLTWLSWCVQSGSWSSFRKWVWFTESHIVLVIYFYL